MSQPEPDLPRDPAEYRPKPLMGWTFWAMLAFGMICVLAGVAVAMLAPRLLAPPAPAPAAAPTPAPQQAPRPVAAPVAPPAPAPGAGELARLNARIAELEREGARTSQAAAAALAAAELIEAAGGSRPFGRELAALRAAAPGLPELDALAPLAGTGAPSRTALAASFPPYAARAASRARKPADDAGLGARIAYTATRVVSVRRVDDALGNTPDALLARAEEALAEGDVLAAVRALDGLPPAAQRAMAPWRAEARRRAEIDAATAALRRRAAEAYSQGDGALSP